MTQKFTVMGSVLVIITLQCDNFVHPCNGGVQPLKQMAMRAITFHELEGRDSSVGALIPASHRHQPQTKSCCWAVLSRCLTYQNKRILKDCCPIFQFQSQSLFITVTLLVFIK